MAAKASEEGRTGAAGCASEVRATWGADEARKGEKTYELLHEGWERGGDSTHRRDSCRGLAVVFDVASRASLLLPCRRRVVSSSSHARGRGTGGRAHSSVLAAAIARDSMRQ